MDRRGAPATALLRSGRPATATSRMPPTSCRSPSRRCRIRSAASSRNSGPSSSAGPPARWRPPRRGAGCGPRSDDAGGDVRTERRARRAPGSTCGHVAVGAMLFGGELDIPTILARFTTSYPEVEVRLRDGIAGRFLEMLESGSLDVAFALEAEPAEGVQRAGAVQRRTGHRRQPRPSAGRGRAAVDRGARGEPADRLPTGLVDPPLIDDALTAAHVEHQIAFEASDLALLRSLVRGWAWGGDLPRRSSNAWIRGVLPPAAPGAANDGRAVVAWRPPGSRPRHGRS